MTLTATSTRDRLLEAGAGLFIEVGYAETTLRTLADRVGVKAGSIYYHFASKDELLTEVLRIGIERISAAFEAALLDAAGQPPEIRLRRAIGAHLEALFGHGPFTATHVAVFNRIPGPVRDEVVPLRDAYEARWVALYDSLRADDATHPDIDLHLARLTLLGAMNSALEWFDPSGDKSLDALIQQIAHLHWSGIRNTTYDHEDEA